MPTSSHRHWWTGGHNDEIHYPRAFEYSLATGLLDGHNIRNFETAGNQGWVRGYVISDPSNGIATLPGQIRRNFDSGADPIMWPFSGNQGNACFHVIDCFNCEETELIDVSADLSQSFTVLFSPRNKAPWFHGGEAEAREDLTAEWVGSRAAGQLSGTNASATSYETVFDKPRRVVGLQLFEFSGSATVDATLTDIDDNIIAKFTLTGGQGVDAAGWIGTCQVPPFFAGNGLKIGSEAGRVGYVIQWIAPELPGYTSEGWVSG